MKMRLSLFQLRKHLQSVMISGILMAVLNVGAVLLYEEELIEALSQARAGLPFPAAALGIYGSASLAGHLASLCYGFLLPSIGFALAVRLASGLMAGQEESGEMAYYLALPIRRGSLVLSQTLALFGCLLVVAILAGLGGFAAAALLKPGELRLPAWLLMQAGLLVQWMLAGAIALYFSCGTGEKRRAARQARLLIALFWLVSLLSRPHQMPAILKYLGLFALIDQQALAATRPLLEMLLPLAAAALFLLLGLRRFAGRDLML